ncbi:MAG TPA: YihY/virulence factor BrkB family protein [Alphaproteobacteria bacterium]
MSRRPSTPSDRGRDATAPSQIPKAGWRDILLRVKAEIADDHVSVIAAGVAFYGLLALFPAIAALIGVAGLMLDPAAIEGQLAQAAAMLPEDAAQILQDQAQAVAQDSGGTATFAVIGGLALALYSASSGMRTLMEGMNIAYDEEEKRGFVRLYATALALTALLIVGAVVALGALLVLPALLGAVGLGSTFEALLSFGRWPVLAVLMVLGLAVIYRYAPSRENARWRWITPGSVVATVLWLVGSLAFSIYVRNFGSYNETYGSIGGVIILLMWLWLSAFIVLLGAELNAEMEHQTKRDTTTGGEQPMGRRGARMADSVGERP